MNKRCLDLTGGKSASAATLAQQLSEHQTELVTANQKIAELESECATDKCEISCWGCDNRFSVFDGEDEINFRCPVCALKNRMAEAEGLLGEIGSGYCSDCELQNGLCIHQRIKAFLTPDAPATEPGTGDKMDKLTIAIEALEKLARFGNAPMLGNSDGNRIAQDALRDMGEATESEYIMVRREDLEFLLSGADDYWMQICEHDAKVIRLVAALNPSPPREPDQPEEEG